MTKQLASTSIRLNTEMRASVQCNEYGVLLQVAGPFADSSRDLVMLSDWQAGGRFADKTQDGVSLRTSQMLNATTVRSAEQLKGCARLSLKHRGKL